MRVQMGPSDIPLADGSADWNSVVENALALWNEQMDRHAIHLDRGGAGTPASEGDGVNSIQFSLHRLWRQIWAIPPSPSP